jgi:hypothetical protein
MKPALASADRGRGTPHRLVVLGSNIDDTVSAIGGLIVDSVRAGWDVEVFLETEGDERRLRILGVTGRLLPGEFAFEHGEPDAVYVHAELHDRSRGVRKLIADVTRRRIAEVATWGGGGETTPAPETEIEYRLSAAASAFKQHAMRSSAESAFVDSAERFLIARSGHAPLPPPLDRL